MLSLCNSHSLRAFATDWKQAQKEKDIQKRGKLKSQRSLLIQDGLPSEELVLELRTIFSWYARSQNFNLQDNDMHLTRVEASRLWYRCGMKLSSLETLLQEKSPPSKVLRINDFLILVQKVIREEEESMSRGKSQDRSSESFCEVSFLVGVINWTFGENAFSNLQIVFRSETKSSWLKDTNAMAMRQMDLFTPVTEVLWWKSKMARTERGMLIHLATTFSCVESYSSHHGAYSIFSSCIEVRFAFSTTAVDGGTNLTLWYQKHLG